MPAEPPGSGAWAQALEYIAGRRRAEEALGFLAACGQELAATLDDRAALARVAQLAVPFLADRCDVELITDGGALESVAAAATPGADGPRAALAEDAAAGSGPALVGDGRLLVAPVAARDLAFGRIVLARGAARPPFAEPDLALVAELARRVAAAVELARLHRRTGAGSA